ncbi:MAG: hypothetical protein GX301_06315 [Gracilibacteraceae bacterium]|nr:hypothetical protein [Gracilibacteraceae bacterium]
MKRYMALFTAVLFIISALMGVFEAEAEDIRLPYEIESFSDVPENHWAYEPVHYFRYLNITRGMDGNVFGLGQQITKSEFITMLVRIMGWKPYAPENGSFSDVSKDKWYYPYIEAAATHEAILKDAGSFNPEKPITRLEIAEAIVRAFGYAELADQLKNLPSEFEDVVEGAEYVNIIKDFGISKGVDGSRFLPDSTAKREEAVAMLRRMYQRINSGINELHAFYAIKSYDQADMIKDLDSVSFGWSRLEYDENNDRFEVAFARNGKSDFFIPAGYSEPINIAKQSGLPIQLNLFASNETKVKNPSAEGQTGIIEYLLTDAEARSEVIDQIVRVLNGVKVENDVISFDGIVIDFENLRGERLKQLFNKFLSELSKKLAVNSKKLYVAVHPERAGGQVYYDGYDYRFIGEIADRVILMAHDYNAISLTEAEMATGYNDTPLTPINEVYYALKAITDENTGVADLSKVWLQLSFDAVQWKMREGKVINKNAFRPSYIQLIERINKEEPGSNLSLKYSERIQNPWLTYYNSSDGTDNIIWYEDKRSINAKIQLAKLFGINGISLWRLGNIPDFEDAAGNENHLDVWQTIIGL